MKNSAKVPTQSFVPLCLVAILILFGSLLTCTLPLQAQAPVAATPAIEAKAQSMLAKLTLEQKIELIGGVDSMFTNAIPAINLPRFKMSDASVGVRTGDQPLPMRVELPWRQPGTATLPANWVRAWEKTPARVASTSCLAPASTSLVRP